MHLLTSLALSLTPLWLAASGHLSPDGLMRAVSRLTSLRQLELRELHVITDDGGCQPCMEGNSLNRACDGLPAPDAQGQSRTSPVPMWVRLARHNGSQR